MLNASTFAITDRCNFGKLLIRLNIYNFYICIGILSYNVLEFWVKKHVK